MNSTGTKNYYTPVIGNHCESSAIVNALSYLEYSITEEQIIGAGTAPGFVYEKSEFPFLGGRSHQMKECFSRTSNIPYSIIEESTMSDWDHIADLIDRDIPVILRVDMRYLPYLFNGKIGPSYMSFGWHYITLFELDKKSKRALVSDTAHSQLQSIKLSALKKARFSRTKVYPPNGEYYFFERASSALTVDWNEIAKSSLIQYYINMNHKSDQKNRLVGLTGLNQLSQEILDMPKSVPSFLIGLILDFHYGCIETNGTGGAAFRTMYYRFLKNHLFINSRDQIIALVKKCEQSWNDLGLSYKEGATNYRKGNKERKKEALLNITEKSKAVYEAEFSLVNAIKETFEL